MLDSFALRWRARFAFSGALLTAAKAVSAFAAPAQTERGTNIIPEQFHDQMRVSIAIMSSLVLWMMLAIIFFELPLLEDGGRDAVKRLTLKLGLFDGVLMWVLLLVLAAMDFL